MKYEILVKSTGRMKEYVTNQERKFAVLLYPTMDLSLPKMHSVLISTPLQKYKGNQENEGNMGLPYLHKAVLVRNPWYDKEGIHQNPAPYVTQNKISQQLCK